MTDHHDPKKLPADGAFDLPPQLKRPLSRPDLQVARSQMRAYGALIGQVSEHVDDFMEPSVDVEAYIVGTLGFRPDEPPPRPDAYVYAALSAAEQALLNAHFAGLAAGAPPTAIAEQTVQGWISYGQLRRFILKKVAG